MKTRIDTIIWWWKNAKARNSMIEFLKKHYKRVGADVVKVYIEDRPSDNYYAVIFKVKSITYELF